MSASEESLEDNDGLVARLYRALVGDAPREQEEELAGAVVADQPRNFMRHVAALGATKTGDGLVDPKLVLSWLLGALEAPSAAIGLLVPVREAGALLPQLALSGFVTRAARRKRVWAAGAAGQAFCVAGMAAVALTLEGKAAGIAIVALLAAFALFRSLCSVSYKPLQGATLVRATRGTATGAATSIAATIVLAFGALLAAGVLPLTTGTIATALFVATGLWFLASGLVLGLHEGARDESGDGRRGSFRRQLGLLRTDAQFARFVTVRSLLVATALAPPYLVTTNEKSLGVLGPFVVASSLASVASSFVWGRLADRSSRRVLLHAGWTAAIPLAGVAALMHSLPAALEGRWILPIALFALMVAYNGVRVGRSTHVVDMASDDRRAQYAAVSNTVVGVVLLLGGAFGWVADAMGRSVVLVAFAAACLAASWVARGLDEVQ